MRNRKIPVIIAIVSLLVIGGYFIYKTVNKPDIPSYSLQKSSGRKIKKKTTASSSKPKKAIDEARSTLENQEQATTQETQDVATALQAGLKVLSKAKGGTEVKNDYNSHLQNTSQELLKITVLMFKAGYKYKEGSLEVYKSDSDNVNQFVFAMSKDGVEDISFAGNYVQGTQQIEIANQHGTAVGLAQ